MMFDHLAKTRDDRDWTGNAGKRHPRPLLVILPAALLSWAFVILIGIAAARFLGL
jgi:hypothetical protein